MAQSQVNPYKVLPDPKHPEIKMLVGPITKYAIMNDSAMNAWYSMNQKYFNPSQELINKFADKPNLHYIVFGGTWCEDTRVILPGFFKLMELAGVKDSNITFMGVDREKNTISPLAKAMGITNVPTIIIMKDGKELGRTVEYGKTGKWSEELGEIATK